LADADAAFAKAKTKAQEDLNKGLADAQKTLQKALLDAQKDYEKAIDKINEATKEKLDDLREKLKELQKEIAELVGKKKAAFVLEDAPDFVPIPKVVTPVIATTSSETNVTVTTTNLTDPNAAANAVLQAIKYGNAVIPTSPSKLAAGESGVIGAASIKAQTPKLSYQYIKSRAG